jgi:CheY-like chemotaxis protein
MSATIPAIDQPLLSTSPYILVIEDEPDIASVIKQTLELLGGYDVVTAANEASVQIDAEHCPALILLDMMLPRSDGWEVYHHLRADSLTAHVPIILMSANAPLLKRAAQLGAAGYLEKPFDIDTLLAIVAASVA